MHIQSIKISTVRMQLVPMKHISKTYIPLTNPDENDNIIKYNLVFFFFF